MEVKKIEQHILTFWLSTTNGVEPYEETFFARKFGAQIHEVEQKTLPKEKSEVLKTRTRG